jgi:hypothetical protein
MTNLLYSWKENLTLLLPRNLKPFALVTLKSIVECYKLYFKYFWWIPAITLAIGYSSFFFLLSGLAPRIAASNLLNFLFSSIIIISVLSLCFINPVSIWLATRSSIDPKNCTYFRKMFITYLPLIILINIMCLCGYILIRFPIIYIVERFFSIPGVPWKSDMVVNTAMFVQGFLNFLVWTWSWIAIFFITDSPATISMFFKNCTRAIRMVIYNLPLFYVVHLIKAFCLICYHGPMPYWFGNASLSYIGYTSLFLLQPAFACISLILQPILICTLANIYIKRVYEQCDLYFKPQEIEKYNPIERN